MKNKRFLYVLMMLIFASANYIYTCTTVIISGKYTKDGRPIIWKHRDTGNLNNKLIYLNTGKYKAIALIDSEDEKPESIWMGFNSAGFCIMNSASYNLKGEDSTNLADMEGVVMKAALLNCATVDDFERFLKNYKRPIGVEANFGVIDAFGGAAYFETNNFTYTKIDVNDKKIAPHGYVVRTNYSFTGEEHNGAGYIRYETAEKLFFRASGSNNLSLEYMIENLCLSLENSYSRQNLQDYINLDEKQDNFIYYQDCINRYSSAASVIIQGIKPGENINLTTMWAMVGFPLASVPVPVWLTPDGNLPEIVQAKGKGTAWICDKALELKKIMVPSYRGSTKYYINTTKISNAQGSGITQKLFPLRKEIIEKTNNLLNSWRSESKLNIKDVNEHYKWIDEFVKNSYTKLFNL